MLKVLLVSYAFPPLGGVGVLRAASLARYLPAEDIRLDVLTARNAATVGNDVALLKDIPPEVTIHRTYTLDLPFAIRKWIKSLVTRRQSSRNDGLAAPDRSKTTLPGRLVQRLLRPDPQVTWLPVLSRSSRRIVKRRRIDLVLITAPPFSSLLLVERLRKTFPSLPIMVDFRDEWLSTTFDSISVVFNSSQSQRAFAAKVEETVIRNATAVVMATEAARREVRARYPHDREDKFHTLPNGFDVAGATSSRPMPLPQQRDKIVVTYIGTIYASTDPMTVVEALRSLPHHVKARFVFRFIGHIEEPRFRGALLELSEMVELSGYRPQREALACMRETDYALLIDHTPLSVGSKFYDYIGSGKPILGALHPEGETRRLLEELRAGWWAPNKDVEGIRQLFLDTVARGKPPLASFHPDLEKIALYERKQLAQKYAELLHSISGRVTGRGFSRILSTGGS